MATSPSHIREHGLTVVQYDAMMAAQGGLWAIPGCTRPAAVIDHDHFCCPGRYSCGKCVRGILCRSCNARGVWDADWRYVKAQRERRRREAIFAQPFADAVKALEPEPWPEAQDIPFADAVAALASRHRR